MIVDFIKVPGLLIKYVFYVKSNVTDLETVPFRKNTPLTSFLLFLESVLEVVVSKQVEDIPL